MVQWPLMKETITLIDKIKMVKFILSTKKFTNGAKVKEFEKIKGSKKIFIIDGCDWPASKIDLWKLLKVYFRL